ncbi:MAG: hypothetical protein SPK34_10805 [Bacteroidaceae bacterium]|nr:hypothetical protein [Bacteroidaceae bacterium]
MALKEAKETEYWIEIPFK